MYLFRNDYSHGAHPKVLEALCATNLEGNIGYGFDPHCERAAARIKELCKAPGADVQFLIGGTSANFVAICAFLRPWEAVFCADSGHINGHEVGAVEGTGHKIIALSVAADGKLSPDHMAPVLKDYEHLHMVSPRLVYLSNATETGAVYTLAELEALSAFCKEHGLLLFVDGARLGAALASPVNDVSLADLARLSDAFYIGGTKNGALMGEALVIVTPSLQPDFFRLKKQRGGVLAKGWLLGAQFEALFTDDLYFNIARHADEMAARLQKGVQELGLSLLNESPTNQVFPIVPNALLPVLDKLCAYEYWSDAKEPNHTVIRFVTSFATPVEDVDGLLSALRQAIASTES